MKLQLSTTLLLNPLWRTKLIITVNPLKLEARLQLLMSFRTAGNLGKLDKVPSVHVLRDNLYKDSVKCNKWTVNACVV